MIHKTYDGTLAPDGHIELIDGVLPDQKMRVLITVLGPDADVAHNASAMTFESYLRTMPDVGTDADFSRIEGSMRDVDLAD
ncbi:MAG: hypothetical protein HYV60_00725 [Planctomycetia bacterium]|nr:hypothetical protein [Planctomycetia bacterium]